jgi:hypothetical protein
MADPSHARATEVVAALEAARIEFHALLGSVARRDWDRPSANPAWTNGQLLVHIAFAYLLVLRLWRVMQLFDRLPRSWSCSFARLLDWSTPLYHRINALLPRLGTRAYGPDTLANQYDRIHARVLRRLASVRDEAWQTGMHYPVRWDPRFREYMTLEDLVRWSALHLWHHSQQIRPAPRAQVPAARRLG